MKIISWNCNMAFRNKASLLSKFSPDVLVILECEHIDKINFETWDVKPTDHHWYGNNPHKGVAVFTFNDYKIDASSIAHNDDFRYIVPLKIYKANWHINLFAVWTQDSPYGHIWHTYYAAEYYADEIKSHNTVIIGDLNSNPTLNKSRRKINHPDLVSLLETMNVFSAYHHMSKESQGEEGVPTLYFQRNKEKPYHIDYCFLSNDLLMNMNEFSIGLHDDYIRSSDHMPLILDISHK